METSELTARFRAAFVSPDAQLAVAHALGLVLLWFVLKNVLHVALRRRPALQAKASILAYLATTMVPILVLSWAGFSAMDNLFADRTPEERLLGVAPGAIVACRMQITYQVFSLISALTVGSPVNSVEMILHHIGAGLIGFLSLAPYVQTYAVFYGGFVELSNIPLTYVDLCKQIPQLKEKLPTLHELNRGIFAIIFIVLRNILWPYFTARLCYDMYVLREKLPMPVLVGTGFCIVSLTTLQFVWGKVILSMAIRSAQRLSGDKKAPPAVAQTGLGVETLQAKEVKGM